MKEKRKIGRFRVSPNAYIYDYMLLALIHACTLSIHANTKGNYACLHAWLHVVCKYLCTHTLYLCKHRQKSCKLCVSMSGIQQSSECNCYLYAPPHFPMDAKSVRILVYIIFPVPEWPYGRATATETEERSCVTM